MNPLENIILFYLPISLTLLIIAWMKLSKHHCKADDLYVAKDATEEKIDDDFIHITYHLYCIECGKHHDIKYAHMIGGANEFLKREKDL